MGPQPPGTFEVRGFRKSSIQHNGHATLDFIIDARERVDVPYEKPVFKPTLPLSVILPTWRLGGLDVTLGALAKQNVLEGVHVHTDSPFEVLLVDALHPWRDTAAIRSQLSQLPFPVKHLAVENSIFPVSSHSRFRNTAMRKAEGERLVFLTDYSCPAPNFLEQHLDLAENIIGISTWVRTALHKESIAEGVAPAPNFKLDNVWDVIEQAKKSEFLWSTFKPGCDPLAMALERERSLSLTPPKFPRMVAEHHKMCTLEYLNHWKAESVTTARALHVNGWDETFDGNGGYADTDFSLRLQWAGAVPHVIPSSEVRVLDPHELSVAPIRDTTRINALRLHEVRKRRAIRCTYGIISGVVNG